MRLYLHIPFCRGRCRYCAFYSTVLERGAIPDSFTDALLAELAWRIGDPSLTDSLAGPLESVFFGGGTPSLLSARQTERLLRAAERAFGLAADAEVTLEGNPESLQDPGKLRDLRSAGVTRLSLGVQSFDDGELRRLGRLHTAAQALRAAELARAAGFPSLSLDLMWGLPGQSTEGWLATLERACGLEPQHLSAYALTLEEGTPLAREMARNPSALPGEESLAGMYEAGCGFLAGRGFTQYEISSFARPGFRCRHNLGCWRGEDYLGIGPAAVSTLGNRRFSQTADLAVWLESAGKGSFSPAEETLDEKTKLLECVMLRLRTAEGLPLALYRSLRGRDFLEEHGELARALLSRDLLRVEDGRAALTSRGMLVSNDILARLFEALD